MKRRFKPRRHHYGGVSVKARQAYEEAIAVNAVVFLSIYAIVHWLTSDEFNERAEHLVVVFGVLRALTEFVIILPEKEAAIARRSRSAPRRTNLTR